MSEPSNPDSYYLEVNVRMVIDKVHVKAKIKHWYDTEEKKHKERILSYEKDTRYE